MTDPFKRVVEELGAHGKCIRLSVVRLETPLRINYEGFHQLYHEYITNIPRIYPEYIQNIPRIPRNVHAYIASTHRNIIPIYARQGGRIARHTGRTKCTQQRFDAHSKQIKYTRFKSVAGNMTKLSHHSYYYTMQLVVSFVSDHVPLRSSSSGWWAVSWAGWLHHAWSTALGKRQETPVRLLAGSSARA